jgi:hypothetical protein
VLTARGEQAVEVGIAAVQHLEARWRAELGEERFATLHAALAAVTWAFGREHVR